MPQTQTEQIESLRSRCRDLVILTEMLSSKLHRVRIEVEALGAVSQPKETIVERVEAPVLAAVLLSRREPN